uniref:Uncharacterized protein n=1 Tax=Molossus molossus TaxID=27622 RepID=A0A7J8I9K5_MOLMO|nr:hypothetical protein HJG59_010538 [Molossus molossus]
MVVSTAVIHAPKCQPLHGPGSGPGAVHSAAGKTVPGLSEGGGIEQTPHRELWWVLRRRLLTNELSEGRDGGVREGLAQEVMFKLRGRGGNDANVTEKGAGKSIPGCGASLSEDRRGDMESRS